MNIQVENDKQLDTRGGFDEITLGLSGRWIAGAADVKASCDVLAASLAAVKGTHEHEAGHLSVGRLGRSSRVPGWFESTTEGKSFRIEVSPGTVCLMSVDQNKAERAVQRAHDARYAMGDIYSGFLNDTDWSDAEIEDAAERFGRAVVSFETGEIFEAPKDAPSRAEVTNWSKRSRMRMVRAVAQLDYSDWSAGDGDLAMNTLTYPDQWEILVPDGRSMKKHFEAFRKRWARAIGPWRVLWKLEFQGRGAPHVHFLARVPAMVGDQKYEDWFSQAWASIVGASEDIDRMGDDGVPSSEYSRHLAAGTGVDFSGKKFSDPRRIALYFLGHSMKGPDGKEYQHTVPELWQAPGAGPGRFWGFSGFVRATTELELSLGDFHKLARELRKLQRARDWKAQLVKHRGKVEGITGVPWIAPESTALPAHQIRVYKKRTRALGGGGSVLGGWVLLNDALPVVEALASWLGNPRRWRSADVETHHYIWDCAFASGGA